VGDFQCMPVALVTGGSRGVGRGIAIGLGAAGWTVWVSGRSSVATGSTSHLPGSIETTAEAVGKAGGVGIPWRCDHTKDEDVSALAAAVSDRDGRLDLLVNNTWAGYERLNSGAWDEWNAPFFEQPVELFDSMLMSGVRSHYLTTARCARLLMAASSAVVVTVSFGGAGPVGYVVSKAADDRLAQALSGRFPSGRVTSVGIHPGLVTTEGVLQFREHLDLAAAQSPEGVGRVVAALADDPNRSRFDGRVLDVDLLANEYGVDVR
jgi:NAD(P)-dependent dehydrogenase (short-subunit alcohol dehydrogenase family)